MRNNLKNPFQELVAAFDNAQTLGDALKAVTSLNLLVKSGEMSEHTAFYFCALYKGVFTAAAEATNSLSEATAPSCGVSLPKVSL